MANTFNQKPRLVFEVAFGLEIGGRLERIAGMDFVGRMRQLTFTRRGKMIFIPIFAIAMVNFFAFITADRYLGGDARSGYIREGHYFLGNHGAYTEVSRKVWRYSYFHAYSVTITHLLMFATAAFLVNTGDIKT